MAKGGTHYGNMFQPPADSSLIGPSDRSSIGGVVHRNSGQSAVIPQQKSIPMKIQNKSRIRISTDSMQNQQIRRNSQIQEAEEEKRKKIDLDEIVQFSSSNAVFDHGFDPPQKDSGRGTGSIPGGYNRNNDHI
jgi:hypothetical protein